MSYLLRFKMSVTILNRLSIITLLGMLLSCHLLNTANSFVETRSARNLGYEVFDMKLFQATNRNVSTNVLISPLNLKMAMGIIMEGAVGSTASEIKKALKIPEDSYLAQKQVEKWMLSLVQYAAKSETWPIVVRKLSDSNVLLANQFFLNIKYEFTIMQDYRQKLQQFYMADFTVLKKDNASSLVEAINSWMFNRTSGLISSVAEESDVDKNFELALGNVFYFKQNWRYNFSKSGLKCFYVNGKYCKKIKMLEQSARLSYNYIEGLDVDAVDIPYADGIHSMLILLPKQRNGIDQLLQNINDNDHMIDVMVYPKLQERKLNLQIPEFVVEFKINMAEILKSLGILKVFSPGATLYGLVNEGSPVYVSQIFHSNKIFVDGQGIKKSGLVPGSANTSVTVDHPFIFFIRNISDNAVLFAGKYLGPKKNQ